MDYLEYFEPMREQINRAHYAISFSPDKRAASWIESMASEVESITDRLTAANPSFNKDEFLARYKTHASDYFGKLSQVMSPMITGPAKFPSHKNEKRRDSADRAMRRWIEFIDKVSSSTTRVRTKSPEEEIDLTLEKLDKLQARKEAIKALNAIARSKKLTKGQKAEAAKEYTSNEETIEYVSSGSQSAHYVLPCLNADVKRYTEKLAIMRSRIKTKAAFKAIEKDGVKIDIEDDRVTITHDSKPDKDVTQRLKSKAFKWSPSREAWVRKHTRQALIDACDLCSVTRKELIEALGGGT